MSWERHRQRLARRQAGRDDAGFTLVEVLVAFTVLLIVLVPLASLLANTIGQASTARERLTALSLAEQYLELLNNTPLGPGDVNKTPTITALPKTGVQVLQKANTKRSTVDYTIYAEFTWASAEGASDLCTSGSTPKVMDVQVTVRWGHTVHQVTDTTVINFPPAGLVSYGFLGVEVNGDPAGGPPADAGAHAWSSRVQAVPVKITSLSGTTPPLTQTIYPDSYGCAFDAVGPGSYTVSLADPSPGTPAGDDFGVPGTTSWVANADERTAVTQSPVTVSADTVTDTTFQYDEGTLVTLGYPSTTATDGSVTCPSAGSVVCLATGQAPATGNHPAKTPVAELSVLTSSGWTVVRPGMARIAATACAGTSRCLAVGYGLDHTTGAAYADSVSTATGGSPSFSQDTVPGGVTTFDTVTCPSATACYAIGTGTGGPVLLSAAVSGTGVTWTLDSVPSGLTSITSLTCPAAGTCFAIASGSNGPEILSLSNGTTWVADSLPSSYQYPYQSTTTKLVQVTCPATGTCFATGANSNGAEILSLSTGTTWVADSLPTSTLKTLSAVACPSATECYVLGTQHVCTYTYYGTQCSTQGAIVSLTGTTKWVLDSVPTTKSLSSVTCPDTTTCVVMGSTTSAQAILSRTGATTWTSDSFTAPAGTTLDSVTAVGCSPGGHCDAIGTASTATTTGGTIMSLSGTTWTRSTLPAGKSPSYLTGIACGTTTCAAPGATETGALYLDGSVSSATWTAATPSGAAGLYVAGAPIAVSNPKLLTATTLVLAVPSTPATDLSQVGPVFPFSTGYSIAAASCTAELAAASSTIATEPGATVGTTLPMGLLPIEVRTAAGAAVSGATISASVADATCKALTPLSGGSVPASYTLETTGPLGLSAMAMIYDTYDVTVRAPDGHTASVTVSVTPTAWVESSVAHALPAPLVVTVT